MQNLLALKDTRTSRRRLPLCDFTPLCRFSRRLADFGTGAAAALKAAATLGAHINAVVSRGGRPDLAEEALMSVHAPTRFIVGGNDKVVLQLNRDAYAKLTGVKDLLIIPGATHLFEEPGALEAIANLATQWFKRYLHKAQTV